MTPIAKVKILKSEIAKLWFGIFVTWRDIWIINIYQLSMVARFSHI